MIIERINRNEVDKNGVLRYEETRGIIEPMFLNNYTNYRVEGEGSKCWIRIGWNRRYWPNGQLNWEMKYDDKGEVIKGTYRAQREDGSRVCYSTL